MKTVISVIIAMAFLFLPGCNKGDDAGKEVTLAKKYAKFKAGVYKEAELKTWLATLEKAEDVNLLGEEKKTDSKGAVVEVSKVKLADDSVGYINSKQLADAPIVFVNETKAYVRPTSGSTVFAVIPKGELGFIIGEKGLWVQVYVGEINGKQVTQQWVETGYSNDPKIIIEAKDYISAVNALKEKDSEKAAQAKAGLEKLSEGTSVIADMAKEKLGLSKADRPAEQEKVENSESGENSD
jgi:lipoprotein LenA